MLDGLVPLSHEVLYKTAMLVWKQVDLSKFWVVGQTKLFGHHLADELFQIYESLKLQTLVERGTLNEPDALIIR